MPAGKTADSSPPTQRVISIVELLAARHGPLTSAQIADRLELNRSTAGAILAALVERGWARRRPDLGYEMGPGLAALGLRAADTRRDRAWMNAELERLAERIDCGAALTALDGDYLEFLAVTRDRVTVGIESGARIPLLAPAGAGMIAHASRARRRAWLDTRGPERRAEFEAVLDIVRESGHCAWRLEPDSMPAVRVLTEVVDRLAEVPTSSELRGRVLAQLATIIGSAYDRTTLDRDIALPLSYISAPVFDAAGHAVMELQIGPLRPAVTRAERRRYFTEIADTASRIGEGLEQHPRPRT